MKNSDKKLVNFVMDAEEHENIKEEAKKRGFESLSDLIRYAIFSFLESREPVQRQEGQPSKFIGNQIANLHGKINRLKESLDDLKGEINTIKDTLEIVYNLLNAPSVSDVLAFKQAFLEELEKRGKMTLEEVADWFASSEISHRDYILHKIFGERAQELILPTAYSEVLRELEKDGVIEINRKGEIVKQ